MVQQISPILFLSYCLVIVVVTRVQDCFSLMISTLSWVWFLLEMQINVLQEKYQVMSLLFSFNAQLRKDIYLSISTTTAEDLKSLFWCFERIEKFLSCLDNITFFYSDVCNVILLRAGRCQPKCGTIEKTFTGVLD